MTKKTLKFLMEMIFIFILPLLFILPSIKINDNYVYDNNGNFVTSEKYIEYDTLSYYNQYRNIIEDFNIFDEETRNGYYYTDTGFFVSNLNRIANLNAISVIPNTSYYLNKYIDGFAILQYDSDMNYLGIWNTTFSGVFTTNQNCYYINFCTLNNNTYGNIYNYDICINVSVSWANGSYVSYGEDLVIVSDTNYTGNATIVKSPLASIKEIVVDVLQLNTDNVVLNIVFDYTCLWFIMFIIWHLFYLLLDFLLHFWRKEDK